MAMPGKVPSPGSHFSTSIRVILEKARPSIDVNTATGNVYYSADDHAPWTAIGNNAHVRFVKRGGRTSLWVNNKDTKALVLFFRSGSSSGPLSWHGAFYRGAFRIHAENELLSLTNIVPLELYVAGVIGAEMGEHWPLEALKAQAVASRSYAIFRISQPRSSWYDLESTVQDQVYRGIITPSTNLDLAVKQTEGMILKENGRVLPALFHSRCGGQTDAPKTVWNSEKGNSAESVTCPGCRERRSAWVAAVPIIDILRRLNLPREPLAFAVSKVERAPSGRVQSLTLSADGQKRTLGSNEFRSLFGYQKIKSALFRWKVAHESLVLEGEGSGHGVGMCQWGAKYLADQQKDFRYILRHYYPMRSLENLNGVETAPKALTWYAPLPMRKDVQPNHTTFKWVFSSATIRRERMVD